jgi:hypothetical protein
MTKRREPNYLVMLNLFQHLVCFSLLSADAPFIPVHRTGFSGAILINNMSKGKFLINDYVDVKLDRNDYKLIRGVFTSIGPITEYGPMGAWFRSNYICSLDRALLEDTKGMNDLLKLPVQNGSTAIFIIKNIRRLKSKIEKEFLPNT